VKETVNEKSIAAIGTKKKLFSILTIIALLCLTPLVIWASAQSSGTLNLDISATGASYGRGKGNCLQASSGSIMAGFPFIPYTFKDTKEIGYVNFTAFYIYNGPESLTLNTEIVVHIHIDGSFRRLSIDETAPITLLEIRGCTSIDLEGLQYCVSAYYAIPTPDAGYIGTVTKTGPNSWWVDASIPASEQGGPSLCVMLWEQGGEPIDGFCIPLYDLELSCTGTITE
jgi:hypothetical protein